MGFCNALQNDAGGVTGTKIQIMKSTPIIRTD